MYFIVNDDCVIAQTESDQIASTVSCALVIPHSRYKATVCVQKGQEIRVTSSCSSVVDSKLAAIATVKGYLNAKLAPKELGVSPLIGAVFWHQKPGCVTRMYKVFRRVGGGTSSQGSGDLLECLEVEDAADEYEPWQYFVRRKITLYESEIKALKAFKLPSSVVN